MSGCILSGDAFNYEQLRSYDAKFPRPKRAIGQEYWPGACDVRDNQPPWQRISSSGLVGNVSGGFMALSEDPQDLQDPESCPSGISTVNREPIQSGPSVSSTDVALSIRPIPRFDGSASDGTDFLSDAPFASLAFV